MSDVIEKRDPEHIEETGVAPGAPLTKGQRFKRHCARRWWWWLIGVIVFLVVLVIIILFAIVPAVAQKTMDKTKLNIESLVIEDPEPTQFLFGVDSFIDGTSSVAHGKDIDPFTVAFSIGEDEPFMFLPLDGVKGDDEIPVTKSNYTAQIADATSFGKFAATLMDTEEFELKIRGETKIRLGSLAPKVKYREDVTLKGFNKLDGMVITSYEILESEEYNLGGKVLIPNPTVFTLECGSIFIDIELGGEVFGSGVIPDLTLVPGERNTYDFSALAAPTSILKLAGQIAAGTAVLSVKATAVKNSDGQDIQWLAAPLGSVTISVPVNTTYLGGDGESHSE